MYHGIRNTMHSHHDCCLYFVTHLSSSSLKKVYIAEQSLASSNPLLIHFSGGRRPGEIRDARSEPTKAKDGKGQVRSIRQAHSENTHFQIKLLKGDGRVVKRNGQCLSPGGGKGQEN